MFSLQTLAFGFFFRSPDIFLDENVDNQIEVDIDTKLELVQAKLGLNL